MRQNRYERFLSSAALLGGLFLASLPYAAEAKVSARYTGSVVLGYDATCNTGTTGAIRYNSGSPGVQYCNGSAWTGLSGGSLGSGTIGAGSGLLVELQNGTQAAPSLTFYNDITTGIFSQTGHFLNFTTNGIFRADFDPNGNFNVVSGAYQLAGVTVLASPDFNADYTGVAAGQNALISQTATTKYNTAAGNGAGKYISTGASNTAVGDNAMLGITATKTTGSNNTAIGDSVLFSVRGAAASNAAIGAQALHSITTGSSNVAVGYQTQYYSTVTSASAANTAIGTGALYFSSNGQNNTAMGYKSMYGVAGTVEGENQNVAVGDSAMFNQKQTETGMVAVGYQTDYAQWNGNNNVAIGAKAMFGDINNSPSGSYDTMFGASAYYSQYDWGTQNTGVGYQALYANGLNANNTGIGYNSLLNLNQSISTTANDTVPDTALGSQAGANISTGLNNTAIGYSALLGSASTNVTGAGSTAVGDSALLALKGAGATTTAIGYQALAAQTTGSKNVAIGYQAGDAGTAITTGTTDTFVGYQAQASSATLTNATALGNGAIATASNAVILGNAAISKLYGQVTSITAISDRRRKKDITPLDPALGLDFIKGLRPVSYRLNNGDETERFGFIAQDLEQALPADLQQRAETEKSEHGLALLGRDRNAERTYRVAYFELIAPIIKSLQDQQDQIIKVKKENTALRDALKNQQSLIAAARTGAKAP